MNKPQFSFKKSPDIASRTKALIRDCKLLYVKHSRIFCVESEGSKSRAYARMWGLGRIWQENLKIPPAYILEVTHKFNKLNSREQDKVLLHELAHIPKNFSGALLGHHNLNKRVEAMLKTRNVKK